MALTGLAIAAAIGLAKSELVDAPKEQRQRKLAAETQRNSPWTGLKANPIQEADPVGTAMQFGATGAQMGSAYKAQQLADANPSNVKVNYNAGGSVNPWSNPGNLNQPVNLGNDYANKYQYGGTW